MGEVAVGMGEKGKRNAGRKRNVRGNDDNTSKHGKMLTR